MRTRFWIAAISAAAVAGASFAIVAVGQAGHSPANKGWVTASSMEVLHSNVVANTTSEDTQVVLAESRAKYSNPTDLRLSVTSECALWTNTATVGDDDAETKARVEYWITIDGKTVPVSSDEVAADPSVDPDVQGPPGHVVFCNRAARMKTEQIEGTAPGESSETEGQDDDNEDNILIRSYQRTRSANAFNWGALNVGRSYDDAVIQNGKGTLLIQLHARLAAELSDEDTSDNQTGSEEPPASNELPNVDASPAAVAAIGKRTLFIEPVKMANDVSF
jgi:hypothetical protein